MIKHCISILTISFVCGIATHGYAQSNSSLSSAESDTEITSLYTLLARVGVHPAIEAERANLDEAHHQISIQSSLPNPMLMLGIESLPTNSFSFLNDPMTSKLIGVTQSVLFPGKLAAQAAIAAQDTVTIGSEMSEKENELARDIKQAYFEMYHLERAIAVNEYHVQTMNELLKTEEHNLTTASTTQASILDMQLERSDIATEVLEEKTELAMERSELERATGSSITELSMPSTLALPAFSYNLAELDSIAKCHRPMLAVFRSQAERESLKIQREELNRYPDFQVSLDYMQRDPLSASSPMNPANSAAAQALGIPAMPMAQSDMVSAGISIELPFFYGNQRKESIASDLATRTMRLEQERSAELDIHTALEAALAKLVGIRKEYDLLRNEIYPVVRMSLQTSTANYSYGKATIGDVFRDELDLMHREHDRYRLEAQYNETLATIEYLTGENLVQYSSSNDWK